MTSPLPVTTDLPAIERFAYELFCQAGDQTRESPQRPPARLTAAALNPERLQQEFQSPEEPRASGRGRSPIPLAYQLWLAHLLWLEDVLHTLDCRPAEVTSVELAGLQALARARACFLRSHQVCPHCDAVNPRLAQRCRRCRQEL